ncbi:hypothetical protein [Cognatilysobacter bugurensis]|uniref:Uncharacterized protein n=1 Tax=Cognatilysobacter bugurensis TaxID=543356 RepID=A0A918W7K2_9GAMM|nr:hypothetical protein [Lysobacter bugurensis]GHA77509.1 hypothetical protein GCM10007067_13700 [Lysobacter bugurensis]
MHSVAGMTVNERLAHFNLLREFDAAVASQDFDALVVVLEQARLAPQHASQSAAAILGLSGPASGQHHGA